MGDTTKTAIIIGGGIAGASVAFELSIRNVRTTIVDSSATGQATAASAGIIQPWSSNVAGEFYELYAAGAAYYPSVLSRLASLGVHETSYSRNGGLFVDTDEAVVESALARVHKRQAAGENLIHNATRLTSAELQERFPPLAGDLHGFIVPGGGRVDGHVFRNALLAGARNNGTKIVGGSVRLTDECAVVVDGERHQADIVIAAAGAWTNRLLEPLGIAVPVKPQRGQITHLHLPGVSTSGWPTIHKGDHYMVAFNDSRVAVGATRESGTGFDPRVTAGGQASVLGKALATAPGLNDATLIETRVGLRPYPDDDLPLFGRVNCHGELYIVTGFGAAGLTMGPYIGSLVAEAAVSGRDVPLETLSGRLANVYQDQE